MLTSVLQYFTLKYILKKNENKACYFKNENIFYDLVVERKSCDFYSFAKKTNEF